MIIESLQLVLVLDHTRDLFWGEPLGGKLTQHVCVSVRVVCLAHPVPGDLVGAAGRQVFFVDRKATCVR